jgi:cytoskeleton protein RodZ
MTKGSFGELLKRERELREVTLNEVTVATRIPPRFLEAFEREDWEKLPGGVFNRGFVRAIARYLGLDEENLLSEYDLAYGDQRPAMAALAAGDPIPSPPKWALAGVAIAILLLIVAGIWGSVHGWQRYAARRAAAKRAALTASAASSGQAPAPATVAAAGKNPAPPMPQPPKANAADPTANSSPAKTSASSPDSNSSTPQRLDLVVSTSGQTRVRVVADGRIVLDSRLPAGETRRLFAKTQFVISSTHPEVVLLELNGQAMPPLTSVGPSGTMVLSQKDLRQAPSGNSQR